MRYLLLVGPQLYSLMCLMHGVRNFAKLEQMAQYSADMGVPYPNWLWR